MYLLFNYISMNRKVEGLIYTFCHISKVIRGLRECIAKCGVSYKIVGPDFRFSL